MSVLLVLGVLVYHTISKSRVFKLELDAEWCMSMLGVLSQLTRHYITPKVVPPADFGQGLEGYRVPGPHQEAVLQGVWPNAGQPADRAQCLQAEAVHRSVDSEIEVHRHARTRREVRLLDAFR